MNAKKSTHNNLFDTKNIRDLPRDIVSQLGSPGRPARKTQALLELFNMKDHLSADEIMVGLYRLYKIRKTKKAIHTTIHYLIKKGSLKKISRGCYAKV